MVIRDHESQKDTQRQNVEKTKRVMKDRQSRKDIQHQCKKFEDTKRSNQRPSITEGQTTQEPIV